jgi:hypothetical protein
MFPSLFFERFWQMEVRPQVFVAMSFDPVYADRFKNIYARAVSAVRINDVPLEAVRVDESKSGDSILTEIADGVAHSAVFLADVSTIGRDSKTAKPYRNANVMYEVGLALACRMPSEILLIHDDKDPLLFDVSSIHHAWIDFTDSVAAVEKVRDLLMDRLKERDVQMDARIRRAVASLSTYEMELIRRFGGKAPETVWNFKGSGTVNLIEVWGMPGLLEKGLVRLAGEFETGELGYQWTPLGRVVADIGRRNLTKFRAAENEPPSPPGELPGQSAALPPTE